MPIFDDSPYTRNTSIELFHKTLSRDASLRHIIFHCCIGPEEVVVLVVDTLSFAGVAAVAIRSSVGADGVEDSSPCLRVLILNLSLTRSLSRGAWS